MDRAGNSNSTSSSFTTDGCSSSSSSSSSTSSSQSTSFWTSTYLPTDQQFKEGYSKALKKGERVRIKIGTETHHIGVIKISSNIITVNVSSTPQQADLKIGETKKFEVTNDSYYDVNV